MGLNEGSFKRKMYKSKYLHKNIWDMSNENHNYEPKALEQEQSKSQSLHWESN